MSEGVAFREIHHTLVSDGINEVESQFLKLPQAECNLYHRFGPNLYIREVTIPAGTFALGHHQRKEHLNVFLKGRVMMFNEDGTTTELVAPMMFVGKPGRKVGYIIEEMVWQNIYSTPERDIDKLEAEFLDKSECWIESESQRKMINKASREIDREAYRKVLELSGFTEETARQQSEDLSDFMDIDVLRVQVGDSDIEGKGLFATSPIKAGEVIAPARIGAKRTIAGRFTNHAFYPNALMKHLPNVDIALISTNDLNGC